MIICAKYYVMNMRFEDIPKLLELVKKYPTLNGGMDIPDVTKQMEATTSQLMMQAERLQGYVTALQQNCTHDWLPEKVFDGLEQTKVTKSRTCNHCGLYETRPDKMPWTICWVCWSPMKADGVTPGQGERHHHYKCTNPKCGHTHTHT